MINKLINNINKTCNSFNRLNILTKIFIIFLVLVFIFLVLKNSDNSIKYFDINNLDKENFDNLDDLTSHKINNKYIQKIDNNIFDKFYAKYYDDIHLNKKKINFEVTNIINLRKKNKYTKILDVGCGTGNHVNSLNELNYDVLGLDQSEAMLSKAGEK